MFRFELHMFAIIGVLLMPMGVRADQSIVAGFDIGNWELTLGGADIENRDIAILENGMAKFADRRLSEWYIRTLKAGERKEANDGQDFKGMSLGYRFDFHRIQPYVGASISRLQEKGEDSTERLVASPHTSLTFFVNPTMFIFSIVDYEFTLEQDNEAKINFRDGRFVYGFGIGLKW